MLTRLQVDGFKNLLGLDVHFGPYTCIAGPNAVGKSNVFDAIEFLSLLAAMPIRVRRDGRIATTVQLRPLPETWQAAQGARTVLKTSLSDYLTEPENALLSLEEVR